MSSRFCSVFSIIVIISSFLLGLVHAAGEVQTRIGNETIERVGHWHFLYSTSGFSLENWSIYPGLDPISITLYWNDFLLQTVQLRTHSLYAPYIDQDLHNRHVLHTRSEFHFDTQLTVDGGTLVPIHTWCVVSNMNPSTNTTELLEHE